MPKVTNPAGVPVRLFGTDLRFGPRETLDATDAEAEVARRSPLLRVEDDPAPVERPEKPLRKRVPRGGKDAETTATEGSVEKR